MINKKLLPFLLTILLISFNPLFVNLMKGPLFLNSRASSLLLPSVQKGFSFTPWEEDALNSSQALTSLLELKDTGTEWVVLCFFYFQDNRTATVIEPDYNLYSVNISDVISFIDVIHQQQLKVVLKPMLDLRTGEWRAYIEPSDEWFKAYTDFITFWAEIAQNKSVDLFVIGCELDGTISDTDNWLKTIEAVRALYDGPITYAVNHDRYEQVAFWDYLDYIGIDAYFPLTNSSYPTLSQLKEGWNNYIPSLHDFSILFNKSIIFTEIGYRSINGANKAPWDWQRKGLVDEKEQYLCYEATFETIANLSWIAGLYWWNWEANPVDEDISDYTPY
ncbi:MAG: glycoside hydrolase family 113, partial [Candidatus Heimdallarchaeaceae archaeon]